MSDALHRCDLTEVLVSRLVATQFPRWARLPIRPVDVDGWDNRTFRLGDELSVRLPSAERYAGQVDKEHRWLAALAPRLPLPIPVPLAVGFPAHGYPWRWSVYRWLPGTTATTGRIELQALATSLAEFLVALQRVDSSDGPLPGPHNFFRGGSLSVYDGETRNAIATLRGMIDTDAAIETWDAALEASWIGEPVWLHGDVSPENLIVSDGRLKAVIDFGCMGVGDPACDLAIAWTLLREGSRETFRTTLAVDDAMWVRGRGWALWKALITLADFSGTDENERQEAHRTLREILG